MDGTIDFIVLEHDDVAGCALIAGAVDGVVPAIDGHNTPYVVAMGYDHATRNWENCTLYDDIVKAKLTYEGLRGRGYPLDGAMRRDDSATLDIRGLTDAELAIEIEKAGAAMDFWEKPEEVRLFLRTDADVYLFGSSLDKSLTVEDRAGDDIAPALREVRTYCKDATEKRDPQIIGAMAQAAAAKSATAEGDAGGKKL